MPASSRCPPALALGRRFVNRPAIPLREVQQSLQCGTVQKTQVLGDLRPEVRRPYGADRLGDLCVAHGPNLSLTQRCDFCTSEWSRILIIGGWKSLSHLQRCHVVLSLSELGVPDASASRTTGPADRPDSDGLFKRTTLRPASGNPPLFQWVSAGLADTTAQVVAKPPLLAAEHAARTARRHSHRLARLPSIPPLNPLQRGLRPGHPTRTDCGRC